MLDKKHFRYLHVARGLTSAQIIQRTGILPQSLMVLLGAANTEGLDASKLVSERTMSRVLTLLGIEVGGDGNARMRRSGVIVWNCPSEKKQLAAWTDAVKDLRAEVFSPNVSLAVLVGSKRWYEVWKSKPLVLFLYDAEEDVRVAIADASPKVRTLLEQIFEVKAGRVIKPAVQRDFDLTVKLMDNGVYRANQFDIIMNGRTAKYSWEHVHAAAQEFNCTPESVLNLIVDAAHAAHAAAQVKNGGSEASQGGQPAAVLKVVN